MNKFYFLRDSETGNILYFGEAKPKDSDVPEGFSVFHMDFNAYANAYCPQPVPTSCMNSIPVVEFLLKDLTHHQVPSNVLSIIDARYQFGLEKYKTILTTDNGRDVDADIQQEAGDLMIYLKQAELQGTPLSEETSVFLKELSLRINI